MTDHEKSLPTGVASMLLLEGSYVATHTPEHEDLRDRQRDVHHAYDDPHHIEVVALSKETGGQPPDGADRPDHDEHDRPCLPSLQRHALLDQRRGGLSVGLGHAPSIMAEQGDTENR